MSASVADPATPPAGAAAPAALARAALTAFAARGLAPQQRPDVIRRALAATSPLAAEDPAGVYGALHALAGALDALRDMEDLHAAIASRAERLRDAGARLLALHGGEPRPWPVVRVDMDPAVAGLRGAPRLLLRPQRDYGVIRLDAVVTLCNVPPAAWRHAVGGTALLDMEFAGWKAEAAAAGSDAAVDRREVTRRIAWLCRVGVETVRILDGR
ncbi:hypothetical protein ACFFJB_14490 [Camelimonas abortus]|uniref:Uncharacterized protein n=1 Tax=Camelimonas abortus TaxID=1017184 RepID=A0ABV7LH62_9HYPH